MRDWVAFWNSEHSIYVNSRHREVHYRRIADDISRYIPAPDATVLDYGCGEALAAERIADMCGRLILCDAAPKVRAAVAQRVATLRGIEVRAPDEVAKLADGSVDVIVMLSVAQYLTLEEFAQTLALFRRLLRSGGLLLVGDVIPPNLSAAADAAALLRFAAPNGFFLAAVAGLVRTALSDYRTLRKSLGLRRYAEAEMLAVLEKAGFAARRAPVNIGHNAARMTFTARPA